MHVRSVFTAIFAATVFAAVAVAADAPKVAHPHFNDGGALSWTTKLADAQSAAKSADRLIFIEYGRKT